MLAVRSDGKTKGPYLYRGADVVQGFLHYLQQLEKEIREELRVKAPLNMTRADWVDFSLERYCHICSKPLVKKNQRDAIEVHDPDTGKYAGLVHRYTNKCYKKAYNMYIQSEEGQLEAFPFIGPRNKRQQPPEQVFEQEDCLFCGEPLVRKSFKDAVKDHCHITGEYRGATPQGLQHQLLPNKPGNGNYPRSLQRLRCPPHHERHSGGPIRLEVYPKQHGEVRVLFPWQAEVH